jgi:hypothetical protein
MSREYSKLLLKAAEDGIVSWETIAVTCIGVMSEADVQDMCEDDFSDICPEEDDDEYCPSCGEPVSEDKSLCVCGYDWGC